MCSKFKVALPIVALGLLLFACDGPVGPEGPQGPEGKQGPKGEQGDQGPPGNANMQSFTVTLDSDDFTAGDVTESASFPSNLITRAVVDNGAVLAYTNLGADSGWWPLPVVIGTVTLSFAYDEGAAAVVILRPQGVRPVADLFDGDKVRFLVFPPVSSAMLDRIDTQDYGAVMEVFGGEVDEDL